MVSGTDRASRKSSWIKTVNVTELHSQLQGSYESIFSNSALFLKQQKFRTQNTLAFWVVKSIEGEWLFFFLWAIQSMLHVLLFQNYNCPTWFSFSCSLIILFEVNRMCEDGRFELNVLFRSNCKSEIWVFICLETIFPSNDSLMRLTYIIYSFWLIFSFSQVKLTHSGSLCALLTPYVVIVTRLLRLARKKKKPPLSSDLFFF